MYPNYIAKKSIIPTLSIWLILFSWLIIPLIIQIHRILVAKNYTIEFYDEKVVVKSGVLTKEEKSSVFSGVYLVSIKQTVFGRAFGYQYKELYTLDFSKVNYLGEVHQIIKDELDFPDYYGMNWDAFWDCLTDMVGDPIHIELIGMERVQNKFPRHAKIMLDILQDLKHWDNDYYKDAIKIEIVIGDARYEIS